MSVWKAGAFQLAVHAFPFIPGDLIVRFQSRHGLERPVVQRPEAFRLGYTRVSIFGAVPRDPGWTFPLSFLLIS